MLLTFPNSCWLKKADSAYKKIELALKAFKFQGTINPAIKSCRWVLELEGYPKCIVSGFIFILSMNFRCVQIK